MRFPRPPTPRVQCWGRLENGSANIESGEGGLEPSLGMSNMHRPNPRSARPACALGCVRRDPSIPIVQGTPDHTRTETDGNCFFLKKKNPSPAQTDGNCYFLKKTIKNRKNPSPAHCVFVLILLSSCPRPRGGAVCVARAVVSGWCPRRGGLPLPTQWPVPQ